MSKKIFALILCLFTILTIFPLPVAASEAALAITGQPQDCSAHPGEEVTVSVSADGEGLSYQWYYKNKDASKYKKSSVITSTYTTVMSNAKDGRTVYCVIKDSRGNTVKSEKAVLSMSKPEITSQPENRTMKIGQELSVSVSASGEGLSYQWYYKNKGSSKYKKASIVTDTYTTTMSKARDGRQIYCVITDSYGASVKSKTVTLKAVRPQITAQPQSGTVLEAEQISTSIVAEGEGLTYQWYYKNKNSSKYKKSSTRSDTYAITMSKDRAGRKVYCVVTDKYGYSVKSNVVTLNMMTYAQITRQPESKRAALGKKLSVSIGAKGDGLTYQWYIRDAAAEDFIKSSTTSATYSITMNASRSGRYVYCVIADKYGNTVQSNTVRLLASGSFKSDTYTLKLNATKDLAKQFAFTANEPMIWESSNPEAVSVSEEGVVTALKKGTATITATGTVTGIRSRCKIQAGKLKQIALTFDDGPSTHTTRLLDHLENRNAKVTFFMVGNRMNANKSKIKRMAQQGHELGYHSYSHKDQTDLSSSQILSDYQESTRILNNITGQSFTVWRTPGGSYNSRVLKTVPLPHIMWSVDTRDWETRNATSVYNSIINNASDGAIILLHDLHGTTVDGAIKAIDKLLASGYELVTVTELLSRDGTPPKNGTTYFRG